MTRAILVVVLAVALLGGWLASPSSPEPAESVPRELIGSATVVCPVGVDRTSTGSVVVGSTSIAPLRTGIVAGGVMPDPGEHELGPAGGLVLPFEQLGVSDRSGAFLEFGDDASAASSVASGSSGVTVAGCAGLSRSSVMLVGGSTRNGESLELLLVNPYGSDAVVEVMSASEAGLDSADELASVIVPARTSIVRDIGALLPLRTRLSVTVTPARGLAHAFLLGGGGGDRFVVEQTQPAGGWLVPVPRIDGNDQVLVVATVSPVDVAIGIGARADGLPIDDFFAGVVPARGHVEIPIPTDPPVDMLEVIADGPVVASVVSEGTTGRGVTPVPVTGLPDWLLTGVGAGSSAWVAVPGDADAIVDFQSLTAGGESFSVAVPGGRTTAVPLRSETTGFHVTADVPIGIVWSRADETGVGLGTAVPVRGGE